MRLPLVVTEPGAGLEPMNDTAQHSSLPVAWMEPRMAASLPLGFCFGWAVGLRLFSMVAVEPWGWFHLLTRPGTILAFGAGGAVICALICRRWGLAPLAPLVAAIPAAFPFMPSWIPFFRAYQAVAVDLALPLLALAFFGTAMNLAGRGISLAWADSPRAASVYRVGIPLLFLAISAGIFYTGENIKRGAGFTGDSPQYVLIANALILDRSVDLMPAIMREDFANFNDEAVGGHGRTFNYTEHHSKYKSGYSAAIAPFVALGWLFSGDFRLWAVFGMLVFGAGVTWQTWELLRRDLGLDPLPSAMGTTSIMLTFPMLAYGTQIYPEMVAALMITLGMRFLVTAENAGPAQGAGMGIAMGILLFLHDRFGFFGIPAIFAYFFLTRRRALAVWPAYIGALAVFAAINIYDLHARHYSIFPEKKQYGVSGGYWNQEGVYIGWLGGMLDKGHGALAYAPVFALIPAFILAAAKARPWVAVPSTAIFVWVYLLALGFEEWWAGTSPPGARYLVATYPALAVAAGIFWQTRPAGWVYWLFFLLLGTGLVGARNFYLYADEDYLVHQCYLDRHLAALDLTRVFYDFIHGHDLAAKAGAWLLVIALLTALVLGFKNRPVSPNRFVASMVASMFILVGSFFAAFPENPDGFAERQRDNFGMPKEGEWMYWSAASEKVDAQIPARFLPTVPYRELEDGWVRLAQGVENNGLMIYGRYLKLPPGTYKIRIPLRAPADDGAGSGFIEVVDARARTTLFQGKVFALKDGMAEARFHLAGPMMNVEPRLRFGSNSEVEVGPLSIAGDGA